MNSRERANLIEELKDQEYRQVFADSVLDSSIAAQIRANREAQQMTQGELAEAAGMKQSRISTMENVNYGSWSISTLRRLARAFDLRLVVRFESWGTLFDGIHTRGELDRFDEDLLIRPSFEKDPVLQDASGGIAAPLHERGTTVVRKLTEGDYVIRSKPRDRQEAVIARHSGAGDA